MAGKYHLLAEDYPRALKTFLRTPIPPNGKSIELAIETVGLAQDDRLTHVLIDYLMGEGDGVPKVGLLWSWDVIQALRNSAKGREIHF